MANVNLITLLGHVGTVEVRTFTNGGKVVEVSLATSERWTDRDGVKHDDTQWHKLVIGGKLADIAERYIKKGDQLFASGKMTYRKYNNRDGVQMTSPEVRVDKIELFSNSGDAKPAQASQQTAPPPVAPPPSLLDGIPDNGGKDDLPF